MNNLLIFKALARLTSKVTLLCFLDSFTLLRVLAALHDKVILVAI